MSANRFGAITAGMAAQIALVTERRYERPTTIDAYVGNILEEDRLLAQALKNHGLSVERVDWSRADVDWAGFEAVVVRTTWDYFDRFPEFVQWLERMAEHPRVLNPVETLRANMDKHYLLDLEAAGVPIVPTAIVGRGARTSLAQVLSSRGWSEVVIKPTVSGGARETFRVESCTPADEATFARLVAQEDMLVQPFVPGIVEHGETTVVMMGGEPTHAIRKSAKAGDFRVQDDHGGTVHPHQASPAELALARAAMATCTPVPVYGRADMVTSPDGTPWLMELELIEPELWLRFDPRAAVAFADAIVAALK